MEIINFDTMGIIGKKNPKALIGSQSTVEDLPFSPLILRMNRYIFVLYKEILSHSSTKKWPLYYLWVNL